MTLFESYNMTHITKFDFKKYCPENFNPNGKKSISYQVAANLKLNRFSGYPTGKTRVVPSRIKTLSIIIF